MIQDRKLLGAMTHAPGNEPIRGYGINDGPGEINGKHGRNLPLYFFTGCDIIKNMQFKNTVRNRGNGFPV